ncbi:MAG: hypothetical protein IKV87_00190 [Methanobrevibacter sp.]|nr:hypothetical protein [Methanobrevibacter sp.]
MYFYKLEAIGYEEHWKTIYCSSKSYSEEEFKAIVKEAYIETCKYISNNGKFLSEFDYRIENAMFDLLEEEGFIENQDSHYFNNLLKEKYDLLNMDDCLTAELVFGTVNFPNENTRDFYEERDNYTFVGLSYDDFKGYL